MYVSDENKHLAEDAIIALDNFIQSGDMHDYNEFYNNVMSLQKAATETYINKTDPEISSTYGKYHSDADGTSLGEMVALVRKDGSYGRNATKLIPTVKDFVRQQEAAAVPNLPSTSEVRPEITPTDVTNGERLVSKVNSVANGNTVEPDGFVPTRYENGTGVDLPTEKAIKNLSNTDKNVVNTGDNFESFINDAITDGFRKYKRFYYGTVSNDLANDMSRELGIDAEGMDIVYDTSHLKHILDRHGARPRRTPLPRARGKPSG